MKYILRVVIYLLAALGLYEFCHQSYWTWINRETLATMDYKTASNKYYEYCAKNVRFWF